MKKFAILLCLTLSVFGMTASTAMGDNVALNASVSLNGAFFTGGWGGGLTVGADTVVDGIFLPKRNQWDQGAVWWDSRDVSGQYLTLDLGSVFSIDSFVVQADDNDPYILSYWDMTTDNWQVAWDVPDYNSLGWGMLTRPNVDNNSERYFLSAPIVTNQLKFEGNSNESTDKLFAVSEIQAYGTAVPEPATFPLLITGITLLGMGAYIRKRRTS